MKTPLHLSSIRWIESREMPKKRVVEYECDRCGKTWLVPEDKDIAAYPKVSVSYTNSEGQEEVAVRYDVLCDSCGSAVRNYVAGIIREKKPAKANLKAKEKEPEGSLTSLRSGRE